MDFKESDEVIICGSSSIQRYGEEGTIIDVDEVQIMVRFADADYFWYHKSCLKLNIRSIREKKLNELGI